jgi:hypothetical protein
MLYCLVNSAAWCSRKKQLLPAFFFFMRLKRKISWDSWTVIYIFFITKYCCIYAFQILHQPQQKMVSSEVYWFVVVLCSSSETMISNYQALTITKDRQVRNSVTRNIKLIIIPLLFRATKHEFVACPSRIRKGTMSH